MPMIWHRTIVRQPLRVTSPHEEALETREGQLNELKKGLKTTVKELYPILAFYALYYGVVRFYAALQPIKLPSVEELWIMWATSPFSYMEAVGNTPTQTTQGLLNNFAYPAAMMVTLMLYNVFFSRRLRRTISVPSVFGAGVFGTYLVSWVIWKLSPQPGTGTSIIGFSFALATTICAFADLLSLPKKKAHERLSMNAKMKIIGMSVFAAFGLVQMYAAYLWMNSAALFHLVGGAACLIILFFWSEIGRPSIPALPKSLAGESSRSVLFALVVVVVALLI